MSAPTVVVIGSLNVDCIAQVENLPAPGQTVPAARLLRRFGGKGANQAMAAARQGARVAMIGCVGDDADGRSYLEHLRRHRIDTGGVRIDRSAVTGTALIAVDDRGENTIVVAAGANGLVSPAAIRARQRDIASAGLLMLQFEIPRDAVIESLRLAARAGVPVMLNPSPLREGFPWGRVRVDTLVVNEEEATRLFGRADLRHPSALRRRLSAWNIARLVITRGGRPTLAVDGERSFEVPVLRVQPVDTVGAGDAFTGTLAARLAGGSDFATAVLHGNCAGALATLKPGAQESLPTLARVRRAAATLLRR